LDGLSSTCTSYLLTAKNKIYLVLFSNRTSATGFGLAFLSRMLLDWVVYYLPYYFQILQGSSALHSGVQILPFNLFLVFAAGINGAILSKFG
jgi:hypothetical protein